MPSGRPRHRQATPEADRVATICNQFVHDRPKVKWASEWLETHGASTGLATRILEHYEAIGKELIAAMKVIGP